uniref:Uncharacterized protein n=1 Tax=Candidatus Kentrum sp. FW TaxID=2126338 RepID=A0A450TCZ7_9GAMM|nr:MAG: hypothetical protein BECKFW1821A_GA0114235_11783 [Candidatus Kentron sp. FW]
MQVYTYSDARQKPLSALGKADASGKVLIQRKDGKAFPPDPERTEKSPLDVPSIEARVTTKELVSLVREERARTTASTRFLKDYGQPS